MFIPPEQVDLPDGLAVLGDAACCFNPVYGQGMTVGVQGAVLMRDMLRARAGGAAASLSPAKAATVLQGFTKARLSWLARCAMDCDFKGLGGRPAPGSGEGQCGKRIPNLFWGLTHV